ncbi:sulfatase [Pelagicoccus mobilis]
MATLLHGKDDRPNILFIMSDDHAYQAISAYDNRLIETPNIDRIAKEGILFSNASVTNSICAPSRATILTGKHTHLNGKIDNLSPFDSSQITFPQMMHDSGYQTALFGKLHFGNNPKGFDQFRILPGQGSYYNPDFITKNEGRIQIQGYVTDIITDMTLDWLKEERDDSKPFLLFYLHKAPHREWLPAQRHHEEYTQKTFKEPANLFDDYEGRGTAAKTAEMNLLDDMHWAGDSKLYPETMEKLGVEPVTTNTHLGSGRSWDIERLMVDLNRFTPEQREKWDASYEMVNQDFVDRYASMSQEELMRWRYQRYMQDYLGCIASVDEGVGEVLDYLDEAGLAENTVVVYTSDQGFYLGEHGWFDKRFMYNESFKTPLLMRWPAEVKSGSTSDEMVQNLDFAQTFLELAGVEEHEDMQGESLVPLLKGQTDQWTRDAVYYHYYEYPSVHMVKRHYGIATKQYKLIHFYYDVDEWELYDLEKDPTEMNSVYGDPEYAAVQEDMYRKLSEVRVYYRDNKENDDRFIKEYKEKVEKMRQKNESH